MSKDVSDNLFEVTKDVSDSASRDASSVHCEFDSTKNKEIFEVSTSYASDQEGEEIIRFFEREIGKLDFSDNTRVVIISKGTMKKINNMIGAYLISRKRCRENYRNKAGSKPENFKQKTKVKIVLKSLDDFLESSKVV